MKNILENEENEGNNKKIRQNKFNTVLIIFFPLCIYKFYKILKYWKLILVTLALSEFNVSLNEWLV